MNVVVTGATGFLGRALCAHLAQNGDRVTALSRNADRARAVLGSNLAGSLAWSDPVVWRPVVAGADVVFHLAGAPVAEQRWTPAYKETILASRVDTTRALAQAGPRGIFVSASAVGFYGDGGDRVLEETAPAGDDFLARVCVAWEAEAEQATATAHRVVRTRIGIVLGTEGGPLPTLLGPFRLGLGGPLGSGRQQMPWVHATDAIALLAWAAATESVRGALNVVAPGVVTSRDFARALGRALGRPAALAVPAWALNALVGELAYALLYSQRVAPAAALAAGFGFRFPDIDTALADLFAARVAR